jgi:hypothetical protein
MSTPAQTPNCRLILPNPQDPSDPANLSALLLWANNFVVNKIVAGPTATILSQSQATGPGAEGTGIVTVSALGGYASLTGAGEKKTPGALLQTGPFEILDATGGGFVVGTNGPILIETASTSGVLLSGGNGPVAIQASGSTGEWIFNDLGLEWPDTTTFYAALSLAHLPSSPTTFSWGFTQDQHIYYYPVGGPWTLFATAGGFVTSFNTRTGAVTLSAADVEALFGAAGQLFVGSGAGTGGLLGIGTTGQVLTVVGGTAAWATPSGAVSSVFGRTGAVAAATGDYTAAEVTNAMSTATYDAAGIYQQVVGTTATQTLTNKRVTKRVSTTSGPGATPSIDTDNFDLFQFTALAAAITSMSTNLTGTANAGDMLMIQFLDNGTARAITWGAKFAASTVPLPTTTVISTTLTVGFIWDTTPATPIWRCIAVA